MKILISANENTGKYFENYFRQEFPGHNYTIIQEGVGVKLNDGINSIKDQVKKSEFDAIIITDYKMGRHIHMNKIDFGIDVINVFDLVKTIGRKSTKLFVLTDEELSTDEELLGFFMEKTKLFNASELSEGIVSGDIKVISAWMTKYAEKATLALLPTLMFLHGKLKKMVNIYKFSELLKPNHSEQTIVEYI